MAANNNDFFEALELLAKEKGVSKESLIEKIKAAIVHAVRRDYGGSDNIHVDIDPEEETFKIYIRKEVVEEVTDPNTQMTLEEGKTYTLFGTLMSKTRRSDPTTWHGTPA